MTFACYAPGISTSTPRGASLSCSGCGVTDPPLYSAPVLLWRWRWWGHTNTEGPWRVLGAFCGLRDRLPRRTVA
jgi:hypothetical protein